jgi:hypothetical protein
MFKNYCGHHKMKKYLIFIFLTFNISSYAAVVDTLTAKDVATKFYYSLQNTTKSLLSKRIELIEAPSALVRRPGTKGSNKEVLYYVFSFGENEGYVIVSGDDIARPILGYATHGQYPLTNQSPEFQYWMKKYQEEILNAKENLSSKTRNRRWDRYEEKKVTPVNIIVNPLLGPIAWGQNYPYNIYCPLDTSGSSPRHAVTGCVATAIGQIMKYHHYPNHGKGENSYTPRSHPEYGELSATFSDSTYDWNLIADYLDRYSQEDEIRATASFLYQVGISVNMDYSPYGSGAYLSAETLKRYFNYDPTGKNIYQSICSEKWDTILAEEILQARPVLFSGGDTAKNARHAFILDGLDSEYHFHINWGWGSYFNDGWYVLTTLDPTSYYDFSYLETASIYLKLPADKFEPNNGEVSATYLTVDSLLTANLDILEDVDYYCLEIPPDTDYQVSVEIYDINAPYEEIFYSGDVSFQYYNKTWSDIFPDTPPKFTVTNGGKLLFKIFGKKIPAMYNTGTYGLRVKTNPAITPIIEHTSRDTISSDDILTITGLKFLNKGSVYFNGLISDSIISWTNTKIVCIVPEGISEGVVTVINSNGVSKGLTYHVLSSTGDPVILRHIPDQIIDPGEEKFIADLNDIFSDPNHDHLIFHAVSDNPLLRIKENELINDKLKIMADTNILRDVTITLSATDSDHVTVTDHFLVKISPVLRPIPKKQTVTADSGKYTFIVHSNISWHIEELSEWLSVNVISDSIFQVTCSENKVVYTRSDTIRLLSDKLDPVGVIFTQQGASPVFSASRNSISVSHFEGEVSFFVTSNMRWNILENSDWLTLEPSSGSWNDSIVVTYEENLSTTPRTASLVLSGDEADDISIIINQKGKPFLTTDQNSISFDAGLDNRTLLRITSNINWTISHNIDWINVSVDQGNGNDTIIVSAQENTTTVPRSGTLIIFGNEVDTLTIPIFQERAVPAMSLFNENGNDIHSGDTIHVPNDTGSVFLTVKTNAQNWEVSDNSLWLRTVKENDTLIAVFHTENITCLERNTLININNTDGLAMNMIISQGINSSVCINGINNEPSFETKIYPNPVKQVAHLQFSSKPPNRLMILVRNDLGKVIILKNYSGLSPEQVIDIDLTEYPTGIYFIQILSQDKQKNMKLIKQ